MTTEYKVGDRVRRIDCDYHPDHGTVGQEAEVIGILSSRMLVVKYPGCDNLNNTGGEYWSTTFCEKIEGPTFNVGDKLAMRGKPDKHAATVIAIDPEATPTQQLIVRMEGSKVVGTRKLNGQYVTTCPGLDLVPYIEPPKKLTVTKYVRAFSYGQIADMVTFLTKEAAEKYDPIIPSGCKMYLGPVKEVTVEVEVSND